LNIGFKFGDENTTTDTKLFNKDWKAKGDYQKKGPKFQFKADEFPEL